MTLHIFSWVQFWRRVLGSSSGASWYLRTALATFGNIESYNKTSISQSDILSFRFITSIYIYIYIYEPFLSKTICIQQLYFFLSFEFKSSFLACRINSLLDRATILLFLAISAHFSEFILLQKCAIVIIMNVA